MYSQFVLISAALFSLCNLSDGLQVKKAATCEKSMDKLAGRVSALEESMSEVQTFAASGTSYSVVLRFCTNADLAHYQSLGANIIITKDVNSANQEGTPAAWVSLTPNFVFQSNTVSWTESYNLIATNQIVGNNVKIDSASSQPNAMSNVMYDFEGGFFSPSSGGCSAPGLYCTTNYIPQLFNFGLSQTTSQGESILGTYPVGMNGRLNMNPLLTLNVFLGYWQQNAYIAASVDYPTVEVRLSAGVPTASLRFDATRNVFTTQACF